MSDYKEDIVIAASIDTKGMKSGANDIKATLDGLRTDLSQRGSRAGEEMGDKLGEGMQRTSGKWMRLLGGIFGKFFGEIGMQAREAFQIARELQEIQQSTRKTTSKEASSLAEHAIVAAGAGAGTTTGIKHAPMKAVTSTATGYSIGSLSQAYKTVETQSTNTVGSMIGNWKSLLGTLGLVGAALVVVGFVLNRIERYKAIKDLGQQFQLTREYATGLYDVMQKFGKAETLSAALSNINKLLEDARKGSKAAREELEKLGITNIWKQGKNITSEWIKNTNAIKDTVERDREILKAGMDLEQFDVFSAGMKYKDDSKSRQQYSGRSIGYGGYYIGDEQRQAEEKRLNDKSEEYLKRTKEAREGMSTKESNDKFDAAEEKWDKEEEDWQKKMAQALKEQEAIEQRIKDIKQESLPISEKLKSLEEEKKDLQYQLTLPGVKGDMLKESQLKLQILETEQKILKTKTDQSNQQEKLVDLENQLSKAIDERNESEDDFISDRSSIPLDTLAGLPGPKRSTVMHTSGAGNRGSGRGGLHTNPRYNRPNRPKNWVDPEVTGPWTATGRANVDAARQIKNLEMWAERNRLEGYGDLANAQSERALRMRENLGILPKSEKEIMQAHLKKLNTMDKNIDKLVKEGFKVSNGK